MRLLDESKRVAFCAVCSKAVYTAHGEFALHARMRFIMIWMDGDGLDRREVGDDNSCYWVEAKRVCAMDGEKRYELLVGNNTYRRRRRRLILIRSQAMSCRPNRPHDLVAG